MQKDVYCFVRLGEIMSLDKEKIVYCVPTMQDGLRHTPKALKGELDYVIYGDGFIHFFKILNALLCKRIILLNGFRFCDRCIAYVGLYLGARVIILQHGRNEYFESRNASLFIRKFVTSPRYFYEVAFLLLLNIWFFVIRLKIKQSKSGPSCKLFYFTNGYKDLWVNRLKNLNIKVIDVKVKPPNVADWGTEMPIPRIDNAPAFLIDEPLQLTIGMSDKKFFQLIDDLLVSLDIQKIYVKRHPRSSFEKFKGRMNIVEIDEVPKNTDVLVGYKSNLLFCGICAGKFYQFQKDTLIEADMSVFEGSSSMQIDDYSELSKVDFICVQV